MKTIQVNTKTYKDKKNQREKKNYFYFVKLRFCQCVKVVKSCKNRNNPLLYQNLGDFKNNPLLFRVSEKQPSSVFNPKKTNINQKTTRKFSNIYLLQTVNK